MRLKLKPIKPERKTVINHHDLDSFVTVSDLLLFLDDHNLTPGEVKFNVEWDHSELEWMEEEDEAEWAKSIAKYKNSLKEYEYWRQENLVEVEAEEERRLRKNKAKVEAKLRKLEKERIKLTEALRGT